MCDPGIVDASPKGFGGVIGELLMCDPAVLDVWSSCLENA